MPESDGGSWRFLAWAGSAWCGRWERCRLGIGPKYRGRAGEVQEKRSLIAGPSSVLETTTRRGLAVRRASTQFDGSYSSGPEGLRGCEALPRRLATHGQSPGVVFHLRGSPRTLTAALADSPEFDFAVEEQWDGEW
jgi:hypothetical protein